MGKSFYLPYTVRGSLFRLHRSWRYFWCWAADRLLDSYFDRKLGISSSERRSLAELGVILPNCIHYQPVSYYDFIPFLNSIPIRPQRDVFLDFGSGMGRALCLAARYPFRSVIGVEISPELCAIAQENLVRFRPKLLCQDVRVFNLDAAEYPVPGEVSVIYFFHPFFGNVLTKVLQNITKSLSDTPRRILILFYGSGLGATSLTQLRSCCWLTQISEIILPTGNLGCVFCNDTSLGEYDQTH